MMVKDEEEMLPRCLASVCNHVDEIIVVDTGSSDGTISIAEEFGARVYYHPWEDNFSKHRNQSISYAGGDWFLILDADEEIIDETGPLMREAARSADTDSVTFQVVSLYDGGKESLHTQERLFRNNKGIHYEGRIHNRIVGATSTAVSPVKILHHGYNVSIEKGKLKHERRLKILEREISDDPHNPLYHHYLAVSHFSAPDYEQAARESTTALDLAEQHGVINAPLYAWTHYVASQSFHRLGKYERSQHLCMQGLKRFPNDPDLHFTACQLAFRQKDDNLFDFHVKRYLALHADISANALTRGNIHCVTYDQLWKAWWWQAINRLRDGDTSGFIDTMGKALETAPEKAAVYNATARYYMETGDLGTSKSELDRAFHENPDNEDIIYSYIELCIRLGDETHEVNWWQELLNRFPEKKDRMLGEVERALHDRRMNDAHKLLQALLSSWPRCEHVLRLKARCAGMEGKPEEKRYYLKQVLSVTHDSPEDLSTMGFILIDQHNYTEAVEYFERSMERKPYAAAVHVGLAIISWHSGTIDLCVTELDRAFHLMGIPSKLTIASLEQLGALFALTGEELLSNKQFEAAKAAYLTALEMNCVMPEVHQGLAEVFQRDNQLEKSLEHLQTALKLSDKLAPILQKMGDIHMQLGNTEAARFCYHKAGM
jgi:tetratricopeptide (TPR) repeat protein